MTYNAMLANDDARHNRFLALSETGKIISVLQQHTTADEISQALNRAPRLLTEDERRTLIELLRKLGLDVEEAEEIALDPDPKILHCVRCHRSFMEWDNHMTACNVTHQYTFSTVQVEECHDGSGHEHILRCTSCKATAYDFPLPRICFVGQHTTDPDEVNYGSSTLPCDEECQ